MGFKADYRMIDGYRQLIRQAWDDTQSAQSYVNQHCDVPFEDQGWLRLLGDAHKGAQDAVSDLLQRVHSVVNAAHGELTGVVDYYRTTDAGNAETVDRTYPKVDRGQPGPK
ncbi:MULTISPECIES: hypothetical protein [unclassified Crossiella]|uniref:hypothetical protein n=1 Tax=unclassified Crossiella TaxID=2620835 RepID=UPI002000390B|nr:MULTISPECIES: hypothetical protein [unclassified Crossiella]MCK2236590.1 hypothetical protein [Crossiella sp. S99.2]MCK2250257.1 hypothetical protein [Crossiella sp. S99.1]